MKRIGITGVDGLVGNAVYQYLLVQGYEVFGFSRRHDTQYEYWNITQGTYKKDLHLDTIIHCAGVVDDWAQYEECYKGNVLGTKKILDNFSEVGRIIYISTCSVYSHTHQDTIITESSPCGNFLNAYSQTKYEAEQAIQNRKSIPVAVILRPHVIYGEGDKKIIPRILRSIRMGCIPVIGSGENKISVTHVDNLVVAIEKSIKSNLCHGTHIFNIADSSAISINNLIRQIVTKNKSKARFLHFNKTLIVIYAYMSNGVYRFFRIKSAPLVTPYVVAQMTSDYTLSIQKATDVLGYIPRKSFLDL